MPPDVVDRAGLVGGERILAHAATDDGSWLLGTRDALLVVEPAESITIPWERVETADWDRDTGRLRVTEVADFGDAQPVHLLTVPEPGTLLQLVRERVTASVVLQRRVPVEGRTGLLVIARRPPHGRGPIGWAFQLDDGLDPGDPDVVRAAEAGLRAAREELGTADEQA